MCICICRYESIFIDALLYFLYPCLYVLYLYNIAHIYLYIRIVIHMYLFKVILCDGRGRRREMVCMKSSSIEKSLVMQQMRGEEREQKRGTRTRRALEGFENDKVIECPNPPRSTYYSHSIHSTLHLPYTAIRWVFRALSALLRCPSLPNSLPNLSSPSHYLSPSPPSISP